MSVSVLEYPLCTWKPLQPPEGLISCDTALFVDGIGHIAQYDCYVDMMWEKGIVYYLRDYLTTEIESRCARDVPARELVYRLHALNSKIREYENRCLCD